MSCDIHFLLKIAVIEMCLAPLKYSGLAAIRREAAGATKAHSHFLPPF